MRIFFCLLYSVIFISFTQAQSDWKWPEDPDLFKLAQEKQAFYKIQMQLDKYEEAHRVLSWLYQNTPDLHESIYKDGAKIIGELFDTDLSDKRRTALEDSLLWTYDMRIKYFNDKPAVIDRKAYAAFKLYYKNAQKYPLLLELYQDLYTQSSADISDFNLTPYMTLATYYYKASPDQLQATQVLDIHSSITTVIDEKMNSGGDREKLQKEQDKIDAFLNSLGEIISCDFIAEKLVPKFEKAPEDLNMAKKIFSYSLKAKCIDQPYFMSAGRTIYERDPTYSLAKAMGDRHYVSEEYEAALSYYQKGDSLAATDEQRFATIMGQANAHAKLKQKAKARSKAYTALSIKPEATEAYNLIGNLYFLSFEECKGGESIVKDRAVYIAAYEMYAKANNQVQMAASKAQFPSIEDIFNENKEEGQSITVNCWINESVKIQRR